MSLPLGPDGVLDCILEAKGLVGIAQSDIQISWRHWIIPWNAATKPIGLSNHAIEEAALSGELLKDNMFIQLGSF